MPGIVLGIRKYMLEVLKIGVRVVSEAASLLPQEPLSSERWGWKYMGVVRGLDAINQGEIFL